MTGKHTARPHQGAWAVFVGDELLDPRAYNSTGHTNASAWRFADKLNNEAISRAEDVSEWISKKEAN